MHKLAIVILSYNSCRDVKALLGSVPSDDIKYFQFIVVDNNSDDQLELKAVVEGFYALKPVYIQNTLNVGYNRGNLVGVKSAKELGLRKALIINPDVKVGCWNEIYDLAINDLKASDYVCVGLTVRGVRPFLVSATSLTLIFPVLVRVLIEPMIRIYQKNFIAQSNLFEVGRVYGCAVIIDVDLFLDADLFDENIFLYNEEILWSLKLEKLGFRTHQSRKVVVEHRVMGSSGDFSDRQFTCMIDSLDYILKTQFALGEQVSRFVAKFAIFQVYFSYKIGKLIRRYTCSKDTLSN